MQVSAKCNKSISFNWITVTNEADLIANRGMTSSSADLNEVENVGVVGVQQTESVEAAKLQRVEEVLLHRVERRRGRRGRRGRDVVAGTGRRVLGR